MSEEKKYFAHETAVIDEGCEIGEGVKIWHFSHIMPNSKIGNGSNIGQNVVVSPDVVLGKNVKVQNNVSIYTGVICEEDVCYFPHTDFFVEFERFDRHIEKLKRQGTQIDYVGFSAMSWKIM